MFKFLKPLFCEHEFHEIAFLFKEKIVGDGCGVRTSKINYTTLYCPKCNREITELASNADIILEKQEGRKQAKLQYERNKQHG